MQVTTERRKWRRFGGVNPATEKDTGITARAMEDIAFERVRPNKQTQEEKAATIKQALQTANNQTIVGRCALTAVQGTAPGSVGATPLCCSVLRIWWSRQYVEPIHALAWRLCNRKSQTQDGSCR